MFQPVLEIMREFTTRKLINTNKNTDENILSVNCSEFYQQTYSLSIYWENYSGKK